MSKGAALILTIFMVVVPASLIIITLVSWVLHRMRGHHDSSAFEWGDEREGCLICSIKRGESC